jgi:hypothetical protein
MEMTALQFVTLGCLIEHKADGIPFVELDLDQRTIRFLIGQDWIVMSRGIDCKTMYAITGRGEKAYGVFAKPARRFDGICPDCGERPKAITKSGKSIGYCRECKKARDNSKQGMYPDRLRLCPTCGLRVVRRTSTGTLRSWCGPCEKKWRKKERRRRNRRLLARIRKGNPPLCYKCKERPRYVMSKWVSDYCYECNREYHNEYYRRRRSRRNLEGA